MRIEQLHYLCESAKAGSINSAAENLHMTHQGLNASLRNLEKELDCSLFTTSRHGIQLTKQGQILVEYAQQILIDTNKMISALQDSLHETDICESLTIEAAPVVTEYLLPNAIQMITAKYPRISLRLTEHSQLQSIYSVKNDTCDMAILGIQYTLLDKLGMNSLLSPDLTFIQLFQYKLVAACSDSHPLAHYKSISLKTLLKYPFLLSNQCSPEEDMNYLWLKLHGTPNIKFNTSSLKIYMNTIKSGTAVGFLPVTKQIKVANPVIPGITQIPIRDEDSIHTVGILYHNTKPVSSAMQTIIDDLSHSFNPPKKNGCRPH